MGECSSCDGSGKVGVYAKPGHFRFGNGIQHYRTCRDCGGTGSDEKPMCEEHDYEKMYHSIYGWYCPVCRSKWYDHRPERIPEDDDDSETTVQPEYE